ncbi:hypothetical protein Aperf_G00000004747 [Anoplocephala perfoliata]
MSKNSTSQSDLSLVKPPQIYYDGHLLYHITESKGCRYKCDYIEDIFSLDKGDVAVFSDPFDEVIVERLKAHGVLIVFETAESPVHMRNLTESQANLIDMFVTYLPWSEVPFMYPMFIHNHNPENNFNREEVTTMLSKDNTYLLPSYHYGRRRMIAWMVSNGQANNNRDSFAYMLSIYIQVDVYGTYSMQTPPGRDPFQWMSTQYKFYLAFENSNCRYYITEKATSNALRNNMVPIVMGAYKEDYINVLPPHSFINVDDFKTIRELADYLRYLDKNHTAYAEYFAWKEHGSIYVEKRLDCRLCGFVHQLNAGLVSLKRLSWERFMDSLNLCFYRELMPLEQA